MASADAYLEAGVTSTYGQIHYWHYCRISAGSDCFLHLLQIRARSSCNSSSADAV